jgi:hypothetical protein
MAKANLAPELPVFYPVLNRWLAALIQFLEFWAGGESVIAESLRTGVSFSATSGKI